MTPEEIKEKLRVMNISKVAEESGVSRNMLHRFLHDQFKKEKTP